MTAKEFVKSRLPKARAERHMNGRIKGMQEVYYLIRDGRNHMYMATGKTESNAWVNAKNLILKRENQRYLRLLNYENACKVIEFIKNNDKNDYANITTGGVSMQVSDKNWDKVEDFIKSLNVRYEVGKEAPYKVVEQIVKSLKESGT